MNRIIYISSFMLFMAITVRAQVIFSNDKKVAIGTDAVVFEPSLMVGYHNFFGSSANASIGTAATPKVNGSTNNIGVYGGLGISTNLSQNNNYGNYGILGYVVTNNSHGRSYGLCGMIETSMNSLVVQVSMPLIVTIAILSQRI